MKTPTWCNTVQVLFLLGHSTCFGRLRPKHVEWPSRNKTCTVLHQVGVSFDLYYDARKHKIKVNERVKLYLYSPSGPSRPVLGLNVPVTHKFFVITCKFTFATASTVDDATNIVELHLWGLIGTANHPDMQKIRIIGFFPENRLHWQFEVRLL